MMTNISIPVGWEQVLEGKTEPGDLGWIPTSEQFRGVAEAELYTPVDYYYLIIRRKKEVPMTTIKDSGQRASFDSGMVRDVNTDKARWDLLIPLKISLRDTMLYRWMMQVTGGAKKYTERNWEKAEGEAEYQRFRESAFRHFMQWWAGDTDEDHAAALFFNIQGAEYVKAVRGGVGGAPGEPTRLQLWSPPPAESDAADF